MPAKDQTPPTGVPHASTSAYPEAVLSATDAASGITVHVEADGATVIARDAAGAELWRTDVLRQTGTPATGFPVVRRLDIVGGTLRVVVGKQRVVEVDLKTGAVLRVGEN